MFATWKKFVWKIQYALCKHCDDVPTNMYYVDDERGGGGRQYSGGHPTTSQLQVASRKRCRRKRLWWGWQHHNNPSCRMSETSRRLLFRKGINLFSLEYIYFLSVLVLGPDGLPGVANFIVQSIPSTYVVNVRSPILTYSIHVAKSVGRIWTHRHPQQNVQEWMHLSTMWQMRECPTSPCEQSFHAAIGCRRTGVAWRGEKGGQSRTYPNIAKYMRDGRMLPSGARMPPNIMNTAIS